MSGATGLPVLFLALALLVAPTKTVAEAIVGIATVAK